ncbi:CinA family protein [Rosenbergiella australiborealis]|uniref:Nicotinamide-nucleotide amidohydrolase family protein n=1 Tax=Rosenbergiella australiborealis TaxID=1544696 RepID=A0ABS5T6N8_9GAMM|nr:nicotinamide-nucleotide amidohydrolase family protein [Rosenbergiella australiborealis]MBT0728026.1 nicotinamide-nucleotide amidohydrolase family protein [Rosenbergiella australiborealis]
MNTLNDVNALSRMLGQHLTESKTTITTAESCTGGAISKAITDISGCSAYFDGGVVTYSEQSKQRFLSVSADTLIQYGVVSEAVAKEMAEGACLAFSTTYAISVTGFAGPGGGTTEKPVGTVCFGFAHAAGETLTYQCHFHGSRDAIRQQAVHFALLKALETFFKIKLDTV